MKPVDRVAVLDKALDVLEALATRPGLQVAEVAEAAEISKAAAYRILGTLESRGYVVSYERVRRYSIGAAFHLYLHAMQGSDRLVKLAELEQAALLERYDETVNLGALAQHGVLYIRVLESSQSLRASSQVGSFDDLHATALGKAMLSRMPSAEREERLARVKLTPRTVHTVTRVPLLADQINRAASQGFAIDDEENELGMRCVAAPIVNADGWPVAAISVSGPSVRMTDQVIAGISADLVAACGRISQRLSQPESTKEENA